MKTSVNRGLHLEFLHYHQDGGFQAELLSYHSYLTQDFLSTKSIRILGANKLQEKNEQNNYVAMIGS